MKERSIVELLELMLQNTHFFKNGLCYWVGLLDIKSIISWEEKNALLDYIKYNRVSQFESWDAFYMRNKPHWWKRNNIAPRIKWINKHINKLKKCR